MKTINKDAYKIVKKEDNTFYDILLCSVCSQTCMRCNFSRHKKSPKHIRELEKLNIPVVNLKECPPLVKDEIIKEFNHNTFCDGVDEKVDNLLDDNIVGKTVPLYM
jgi:hypothetical protein